MQRRLFLAGLAALVVHLPTQSLAQTAQDQIVQQLRSQGYSSIRARRTLLGRVRIVARKGRQTREIVFNPSTGAILRDYWDSGGGRIQSDDDVRQDRSGSSSRDEDRDDRDDDDRDDDDRDDRDDDDRDDRDDDDRDDRDDDDRDDRDDDDRDDDRDDRDDDDRDDNSGPGSSDDDDDDDDDDD